MYALWSLTHWSTPLRSISSVLSGVYFLGRKWVKKTLQLCCRAFLSLHLWSLPSVRNAITAFSELYTTQYIYGRGIAWIMPFPCPTALEWIYAFTALANAPGSMSSFDLLVDLRSALVSHTVGSSAPFLRLTLIVLFWSFFLLGHCAWAPNRALRGGCWRLLGPVPGCFLTHLYRAGWRVIR